MTLGSVNEVHTASYNESLHLIILGLGFQGKPGTRFCCGNKNSHHLLCTYYVPSLSYIKSKENKRLRGEYGILRGEKKQEQIKSRELASNSSQDLKMEEINFLRKEKKDFKC